MAKHSIFISYAHEDNAYKDELRKKLRIWELQKELDIELWVDDKIAGGENWRTEIDAAMERADLGVLLLSDDFINSDFIFNIELTRLRERYQAGKLKLFPIVVRPCAWREIDFLTTLQINPKGRDPICLPDARYEREKDLAEIAVSIKQRLEATAAERENHRPAISPDVGAEGGDVYDPHNYADLEIGLYHHAFHEYQLELRFSHSGSNLDNRLKHSCIRLNPETLDGSADDGGASELGTKLGRLLFGDESLLKVLDHAIKTARDIHTPLRLRVCIGPNARELCRVRWETLRHPTKGDFLVRDPMIRFSRYLLGKGAPPIKPLRHEEKSQFRAVVSPINAFLPPDAKVSPDHCDKDRELDFVRRCLAPLEGELVSFEGVPLADWESMGKGVGRCDLLYLTCSRVGQVAADRWTTTPSGMCPSRCGQHLVRSLGYLPTLPRLVILSPPLGAAISDTERATLGDAASAIADAGVPAVITVQGSIDENTWGDFLEGFFGSLKRQGNLSRALGAAREAVGDAADWWAPILLTRRKGGDFWRRPGFEDKEAGEKTWEVLVSKIKAGRCTPILGPGLVSPYIGSRHTIARALADEYHYPLAFQDRSNIQQVTQYLYVDFKDRWTMVDKLQKVIRQHLTTLHGTTFEPHEGRDSLDALIMEIGARKMRHKRDTYRLLAQVPFPLYITTNLNGLMTMALKLVNKEPIEEVYRLHDKHHEDRTLRPSVKNPLVFNLFGRLNDPDNTVITEDDYFDFLIHFGADEKNVTRTARKIPEVAYGAMTGHNLIFVGFKVHQWDFRVLFRALMSLEGSAFQKGSAHVAVQIDPDDDYTVDPDKARRYFEGLFSAKMGTEVNIYWGSSEEFVRELYRRIHGSLPPDKEDSHDEL